jgi:hypothetical protein
MEILSRRSGRTSSDQSGNPGSASTMTSFTTGQFHELIFAFTTEMNWPFSDVVNSVFLQAGSAIRSK